MSGIVSKEMFYKVQDEIKRRLDLSQIDGSKYSNRYAFSGKLFCGICEKRFVGGDNRKRADGTTRKSWHCYTRHKYGKKRTSEAGVELGCNSEIVSDNALKLVFADILKQLKPNTKKVTKNIIKAVSAVIDKRCSEEINRNELIKKREKLLCAKNSAINLCVKGTISEDELKDQKEILNSKIADIEKAIQESDNKDDMIENKDKILDEVKDIIHSITSQKTFSDEVCREMLDKVIVHNKTKFDFYIKGINNKNFFINESNILYNQPIE